MAPSLDQPGAIHYDFLPHHNRISRVLVISSSGLASSTMKSALFPDCSVPCARQVPKEGRYCLPQAQS